MLVLFLGPEYGFDPAQKFLLTALPTLVGAVLRLPYTFAVGMFGGRNWTIVTALLLLVPTILIAIVLEPGVSFTTLLIVAAVRRRRRRQLRLLDDQHQRLLPGPAQGLGARASTPAAATSACRWCSWSACWCWPRSARSTRGRWSRSTSR